jgi:hypothetical protein
MQIVFVSWIQTLAFQSLTCKFVTIVADNERIIMRSTHCYMLQSIVYTEY